MASRWPRTNVCGITINQLLNRPPPPIVLDPIVTPAPDGTYTL